MSKLTGSGLVTFLTLIEKFEDLLGVECKSKYFQKEDEIKFTWKVDRKEYFFDFDREWIRQLNEGYSEFWLDATVSMLIFSAHTKMYGEKIAECMYSLRT